MISRRIWFSQCCITMEKIRCVPWMRQHRVYCVSQKSLLSRHCYSRASTVTFFVFWHWHGTEVSVLLTSIYSESINKLKKLRDWLVQLRFSLLRPNWTESYVGSLARLRKRQTLSMEPFSSKSDLKKRAVSMLTCSQMYKLKTWRELRWRILRLNITYSM